MLKLLRELAGPEADCPDYDQFTTSPLHVSSSGPQTSSSGRPSGSMTSSSGRRSLAGVFDPEPDREAEGDTDPFERWPLFARLQSVHGFGTRFSVTSRSARRPSTRLSSIDDEKTQVWDRWYWIDSNTPSITATNISRSILFSCITNIGLLYVQLLIVIARLLETREEIELWHFAFHKNWTEVK